MLARDFRYSAIKSIQGHWGTAVLISFLEILLSSVPGAFIAFLKFILYSDSEFSFISILYQLLFMNIVLWSMHLAFLYRARGQSLEVGNLFCAFGEYGRVLLTSLLETLYIGLWTLLFIVPGVVKSFSYALVPYLMKDDPNLAYNAAITKSRQMMMGHKGELFCLYFSFTGWFLLSLVSLGIGFLWLTPYVETAVAHFYRNLAGE